VNKSDLIDVVADRLGKTKKEASDVVETVLDEITRSVAAGKKVSISGFGVFEKQSRAARVGRNPRTGATVKIKATSVPKFRAGTDFKLVVSGKKKLAKPAAAKKATAKKATTKKATTKKAVAKKAPAKRATTKKAVAKKAPAKRATTKKAVKKAPARKPAARKTTARKTTAKKTSRR
jgi:DNA-binding protein HU-beta